MIYQNTKVFWLQSTIIERLKKLLKEPKSQWGESPLLIFRKLKRPTLRLMSNPQPGVPPEQLPKFKLTQDWQNFIGEILAKNGGMVDGNLLQQLRLNTYKNIERLRGRPLLVYATRFLDQLPPNTPTSIEISDVDGFTDLVSSSPKGTAVDVLVHSPGGSADATERIVHILRRRFDEVHFIIPHSAYSAATMLALSGDSISLHPSATLGPIDPQLNGIPARSIKNGFQKVRDIVKTEGPEALAPFLPLIEKYSLDLLELCDDSEKLSKELVTEWIKKYMFHGKEFKNLDKVVDYFSDYDEHKTHSRPLYFEKIETYGLNVKVLDGDLKDFVWEAYLQINGFFSLMNFYKLFENAYGVSWGKQIQVVMQNFMTQPQGQRLSVKPSEQT